MKEAATRREARAEAPARAFDPLAWIEHHGRTLALSGLAVAAAAVGVGGFVAYRERVERRVAQAFGEAFTLYQGSAPGEATRDPRRLQQARTGFARAADLAPRSAAGRLARLYEARAALAAGDAASAIGTLESLQDGLQDPVLAAVVRATLALAYERAGRVEEALEQWSRLADEKTYAGDHALFERARLLERSGRRGDAQEVYRALVTRFPQSQFAAEARRALEGRAP